MDYIGAGSEIGGMGTQYFYPTTATGGGQAHTHGIANDGSHTHSIAPITTVPPYYAMAYIMKVY